jgi:hypothetical protein
VTIGLDPGGNDDETSRWRTPVIVLVVLAVVGFAGYRLLMLGPDARARDANGRCLLRARVYTFGEGLPQPRRILGMQNLDDADWTDVKVDISGVVTGGTRANQPTGTYSQALPEYDSVIATKKSREIPLENFQAGDGPRWVPMSMKVTHAKVTAKIAGETCTYETAVPEPH